MSNLSMRQSGSIVAFLLSALAGCTHHYYRQARESDPHATLTFEKAKEGYRPWARKLNGDRRPDHLFRVRNTFRIVVGTMRLEIKEQAGEGTLVTSGPRFTCELSFEAEAGRDYRVSSVWDDNGYLYVVTTTGAKVAECKARERGEGAIVISKEAPVYKKAHGTDVTSTLKRGDAVVAVSLGWGAGQFREESGRAWIAFLDEAAGSPREGWMRLADLAKFTYFFCNYDVPSDNEAPGYPFTPGSYPFPSGKRVDWNTCFREARDAKLNELRAACAKEKTAPTTKVPRAHRISSSNRRSHSLGEILSRREPCQRTTRSCQESQRTPLYRNCSG